MDVRAENRGRPHQKVRFPAAPVVGRNFLTLGHPGVRVRNVRGKSGPKSLCLCCFFFPDFSRIHPPNLGGESPPPKFGGYGSSGSVVSSKTKGSGEKGAPRNHAEIFGPVPLQKCVGDFCCIAFGGFWRGFSWRIFLGTFSHKNEEKKSGDRIREKIRRPKNKNPRKVRSAKNRP